MAASLFSATLLLCLWLAPGPGERITLSLFLPSIIVASYFCGTGASLLTTVLSVAAADWFFVEPRHSFRVAHAIRSLDLLLLAGLGFAICWCGHANRAAKDKLQRILDEAERLRGECQTLFELSAVGQAEVDAATGQFARVNSRFCTVTGYRAEELLGMKFLALTHPDDRQEVQEAAEKLLKGEVPVLELQKRCVCMNGEIIDALVSAAVIKDSLSRPQRLVAAIRDITLQKRVEYAIRHSHDRLEGVLAERTSELQQDLARFEGFCSSIAHDLRAPLRAMHNFATLLSHRYGSQLPNQAREYAQRLAAASLRMDRLLMDLLEYGRVSSIGLALEHVDTEELVRKLVERIRQSPRGPSAEIEIQVPLPKLRADTRLLGEAFENLLTNALKFVPPPTRPVIRIRAEDRGERSRVCIEDNGPGIPQEYHERIFGVFQRLDQNDAEGTGIGLAIVRTAIHRMKGQVGLNSALGKGSLFWVELPKA
jgi:PAS domain S-box-containing protein